MGHTFSNILLHVVFGTKGRRPTIATTSRSRLYEYLAGVAREEFGQSLLIGGTADHVHGLILLRPDKSLSEAMQKWKALSSGWVHKTFPDSTAFAWQTGFAGFSVSESSKNAVREYIERQEEHHRKMTFEEEYIAFLERHNVAYDPRYVWEAESV
jgi:REP element-mobilizing transposase RayT